MPTLPRFRDLSWQAKAYLAATVVASLGAFALGWYLRPIRASDIPTLVYLAVGTQIAVLLPIRWRNGVQSVMDPLLVATGLFAPGAGVGAVAWLATFDGR